MNIPPGGIYSPDMSLESVLHISLDSARAATECTCDFVIGKSEPSRRTILCESEQKYEVVKTDLTSPMMGAMSKCLTADDCDVLVANGVLGAETLTPGSTVWIVPESASLFDEEYVYKTLDEFYEFALIVRKYSIPITMGSPNRLMWLMQARSEAKLDWTLVAPMYMDNISTGQENDTAVGVNPAPAAGGYAFAAAAPAAPFPGAKFTASGHGVLAGACQEKLVYVLDTLREYGALRIDNIGYLYSVLAICIVASHTYSSMALRNPKVAEAVSHAHISHAVLHSIRLRYLAESAAYQKHTQIDQGMLVNLDSARLLTTRTDPMNFTRGITYQSNVMTAPRAIAGPRGVHPLKRFRKHLRVYCDPRTSEKDIFCGFEWEAADHKTVLTGSAITACAVITPMLAIIDNAREYFDIYYPANRPEPVSDENGVIRGIGSSDIDLMVQCDLADFDGVVERHFATIRAQYPTAELTRVETENKHKFAITGLWRQIELFHVSDIATVMTKYHLDCVRAIYDGQNVWCWPSFIIAAHTGLNTHVRWTSNRKDIRDVIMKYYQRGFGLICGKQGAKSMLAFISSSPHWSNAALQKVIGATNVGGWRVRRYRSDHIAAITSIICSPQHSRLGIQYEPGVSASGLTAICRRNLAVNAHDIRAAPHTPLVPLFECKKTSKYL